MTHEHSTEDKEDAGMDTRENTTLTAEMLTRIAGTTRVLEDMQLGVLEDAIDVEELGVMKPADECADQCADEFWVFLEFSWISLTLLTLCIPNVHCPWSNATLRKELHMTAKHCTQQSTTMVNNNVQRFKIARALNWVVLIKYAMLLQSVITYVVPHPRWIRTTSTFEKFDNRYSSVFSSKYVMQ